jgi:4-hydroxy-3-methylbut-2-enyl diphosphate reductase
MIGPAMSAPFVSRHAYRNAARFEVARPPQIPIFRDKSAMADSGMPQRPLTILLASPRGFCAGVDRAIQIVQRALERFGAPVYVRHEIVHNRHVVEELERQGAVFVEELDEIPGQYPVVFSAHGVPKSVPADAEARKLLYLDATCPLVSKVHREAEVHFNVGRHIILIGHAGHPEVEGTMGQIPGKVILVQNEAEVATLDLPIDAPVAYITQTTLSVDDTRNIIAALAARFTNLVGPNTRDICYATQNRQSAVREMSSRVDVILVIGATNSSNSNRLREIGTESGVPSYLIADGSELDPAWVRDADVVGITAGASAPEAMVEDVIAALRRLGPVEVSTMEGIVEHAEFRLPAELADTALAQPASKTTEQRDARLADQTAAG